MSAQPVPHSSLWFDGLERPRFPVATPCRVDVIVVGAGLAGLTTAYLLKRAGRTVAVFDKGRVLSGQSCVTTAHLTWILDEPIHSLASSFGKETDALLGAHASAIDEIERIARVEDIDCDFARVPAFRFGLAADDRKELEKDAKAGREHGRVCDYVEPAAVPVRAPGGAMTAPDQGRFHPLKFGYALASRIVGDGSHVFENSLVTESEPTETGWKIVCNGMPLEAADLVVTSHSPFGLVPQFQTRMEPYQTYAIGLSVAKGALPDGLYWDTDEPYQYTRLQPGTERDTVIVGGGDHKTASSVEDPSRAYAKIERYVTEVLGLKDYTVTHRWSGQVLEPIDTVAYIGKYPGRGDRRWVATGFSGNGMTYSVIAAMLLRDLVTGQDNPLAKVFEPLRNKGIAAAGEFVKAQASVMYHMVVDRLAPAEAKDLAGVPVGEGRLLRVGGRKLAVYRDEHGEVTALSATCPHMGCVVEWNGEEKTWDCPCHGSRFTCTGDLETGPATSGLAPVDLPKSHENAAG